MVAPTLLHELRPAFADFCTKRTAADRLTHLPRQFFAPFVGKRNLDLVVGGRRDERKQEEKQSVKIPADRFGAEEREVIGRGRSSGDRFVEVDRRALEPEERRSGAVSLFAGGGAGVDKVLENGGGVAFHSRVFDHAPQLHRLFADPLQRRFPPLFQQESVRVHRVVGRYRARHHHRRLRQLGQRSSRGELPEHFAVLRARLRRERWLRG
mmetsp:Transcript_1115/g.2397  ORF Transcript_1115/g.2397 Transcript_1115/m.2397 type:complete len:210 (-) Transcript_1115:1705-2334(-)